MFELQDIPYKTSTAMLYIEQPRQVPWIKIDTHLRWLLILIDGVLSARELLAKGLPLVELRSFDQLESVGLIARQSITPTVSQPRHTPSLATARFDILDLILDGSMEDFGLRPWVDHFEHAQTLPDLIQTFHRFEQKFGQQHIVLHQQIRQILAL